MKFSTFDRVRKIKGYKFEGKIIGGGYKLDGQRVLYMVEVENIKPYGWCGCSKQHLCPIDRMCGDCGEIIELIEHPNNCAGMVHIFAEQDIELIK